MELDLQAGGNMATAKEVLEAAGLNAGNMVGSLAAIFRQDHVTGDTVLGFFDTKIQDNLPAVLIQSRLTPSDLTPLLDRESIRAPWKST